MQIITLADDGTVTLELTAEEARQIRDNIGNSDSRRVSTAADRLHGYLETTHGPTRKPRFPGGGPILTELSAASIVGRLNAVLDICDEAVRAGITSGASFSVRRVHRAALGDPA